MSSGERFRSSSFNEFHSFGTAMTSAQRAKEQLLTEGKVVIPINVAALALGISQKDLRLMSERGGLFIRAEDEKVIFELKPDVQQITRDLWREMVESFERCRANSSRAGIDYLDTATKLQRGLHRDEINADEATVYEIKLHALWLLIPPKTQDEFRSRSLSPQFIRSNLGIAGSGE